MRNTTPQVGGRQASSSGFTSNCPVGEYGTPTVAYSLTVAPNATTNTTGTSSSYRGIVLTNGYDSTLVMRTFANGHAQIATDAPSRFLSFATGEFSERMRITGDGNVGIGTTAPSTLFSNTNTNIIDSAATGLGLRSLGWRISENGYVAGLRNDATTSSAHGLFISTSAAADNQYPLMINSGGSPRFFVRGSGQVVVGSALPAGAQMSEALEVNGTTRVGKISQFIADVSAVNPVATLRVGDATGYYPTLNFETETAQSIGSLFGWKQTALVLQSGPALGLIFRTNGGTQQMAISAQGNVGIGVANPAYKLDVAGDANFSGTVTGGNIKAKYQDVAEWVPATQDMAAGTVVVLDPQAVNRVMPSARAYDTTVAGVVSASPGLILGEGSASQEMIATTGRVKVHVDATHAAIRIGDLLVTGSKPGTAMKSESVAIAGVQLHRPGTILGKALEPLDAGEGEILVLLSMQ